MLDWENFNRFLQEYNIYVTAISFAIGLYVKSTMSSFMDNIITPVLDSTSQNVGVKWSDRTVSLLGIEFKVGAFVQSLIEFGIVLLILYLVAPQTSNTM